MVVRAREIYNRSRLIFGILLTFWVLEIIPSIITCIVSKQDHGCIMSMANFLCHRTNEASAAVHCTLYSRLLVLRFES